MILDPDDHPERHSNPSAAFADVARRLRDEVLTDPDVKYVYVMVGPPGSGKSTWAKKKPMQTWDGSPILDGCHADANRRRALARQICDAGKIPIAVWFRTPLEECLRRNNRRELPKRVSPSVVRQQARALEIRPPRKIEGWQQVIEVTP